MTLRVLKLYLITHAAIFSVSAQTIENIKSSLAISASGTTRYNIYYDLNAPFDNIPCEIKVKVTTGDKSFYSAALTGDAGHLVLPGKQKHIIWDHVEELVHYSGEVSITLESNPDVKVPGKIKKGRGFSVELSAAFKTNKIYTIKLFRKGIEVIKLNELEITENAIPVALPPKSKLGRNYQVMISDGEHNYYSNTLKLKPKVGYGLLAIPLLAIPAYVIVKNHLEDQEELPGPPPVN